MKHYEVVNKKVENYLKTRRGKGKEYTREIIKILLNRRYKDPGGWVRAKDINLGFDRKKWNKFSYQTLSRLLADLTSEKIIEQDKKNSREVYYRVPTGYQDIYFLSRSDLIDKLKESYDGLYNLANKLQVAKEFLKELGVSNPDAEIDAEILSRNMSRKIQFEQIKLLSEQKIKKGIEDGSLTWPPIITPDTDIPTNGEAGARFL